MSFAISGTGFAGLSYIFADAALFLSILFLTFWVFQQDIFVGGQMLIGMFLVFRFRIIYNSKKLTLCIFL